MFRRRETMIALRARRQAFRVASEIEHPRIEVSSAPLVHLPEDFDKLEQALDHPPLCDAPCWKFLHGEIGDILLALVGVAAGLTLILLVKYG